MGRFGIDPDAAFDMLRRWSTHTNLKVRDVSQILVTTATAHPPVVPGRASQELIELINRLNKGQNPTATGPLVKRRLLDGSGVAQSRSSRAA